jgi:predicted enzyme related to lactoylglutathione lyase
MANPFAHCELNTTDLKKAKKFYQALFAWKLIEMPGGMPYTMIDVGGGGGGGMVANTKPGFPSAWMPYVQVDSVKKTLAGASKGGATIVVDYMSIGDMGAIGVFIDPTGATLGVWEQGNAAVKAAKPAKKVAKKAAKKAAKKPAKKAAKKK